MKLTKWITVASLTLATFSVGFTGPVRVGQEKDIVDTAVSAGSFKTLVAAVQAAGLVDALKGKGPLTVFAPTDKAFENLEKAKPGTIAMLLKPENKHKLKDILTYHVVSGKVLAQDVLKMKNGSKVKTLNGKSFTLHTTKGVQINKSTVVKTDIMCTNGVIHVIDTVLLPPTQ